MRRTRSAIGWCGQLLAWMVILGVAGLIAVCVVVPRLAGATPYTIATGSMRPTMPPGTMVVVRSVPADRIRLGDVVAFQPRSGDPEVVTHRVVSIGFGSTGHRIFRTEGDANSAADPTWVRPVQIKGVRWYSLPQVGRVSNLLSMGQRQVVLVITVSSLLVYAASMVGADTAERRRRRRSAVSLPSVGATVTSHG